jgi:hypothetical protein
MKPFLIYENYVYKYLSSGEEVGVSGAPLAFCLLAMLTSSMANSSWTERTQTGPLLCPSVRSATDNGTEVPTEIQVSH